MKVLIIAVCPRSTARIDLAIWLIDLDSKFKLTKNAKKHTAEAITNGELYANNILSICLVSVANHAVGRESNKYANKFVFFINLGIPYKRSALPKR